MTDARVTALLRVLHLGQTMWLSSGGNSLWPFVLSRDALRVVRGDACDVELGDLAVVAAADVLIAHIVVQLRPVVTASAVGVLDPPLEVLGRVDTVRRGKRTMKLPRVTRHVLAWVPRLAMLAKRSHSLRVLVQRLRD